MAKPKSFQVWGELTLTVALPVSGDSLEDAMSRAKKFDVHDFVDINGEYMNGELRISGIHEE